MNASTAWMALAATVITTAPAPGGPPAKPAPAAKPTPPPAAADPKRPSEPAPDLGVSTRTAKKARAPWAELRCAEGGFAAFMPGGPLAAEKPVPGTTQKAQVRIGLDFPIVYLAGFVEQAGKKGPAVRPEAVMQAFRLAYAENSRIEHADEKPVSLNGLKGTELRTRFAGGESTCRVFPLKDRILFATVTGPGVSTEGPEPAGFLRSFRSIDGPRPEPVSTTSSASKPETVKSEGPAQPAWREFRPEGGGFSLKAPGSPESPASRAASAGRAAEYRFANTVAKESYTVSYFDLPRNGIAARGSDAWLDSERERVTAQLNGRLSTLQAIDLHGAPGVEFYLLLPEGRSALVRLVTLGGRFYRLVAETPVEASYSDDSMRFLDSFRPSKK